MSSDFFFLLMTKKNNVKTAVLLFNIKQIALRKYSYSSFSPTKIKEKK